MSVLFQHCNLSSALRWGSRYIKLCCIIFFCRSFTLKTRSLKKWQVQGRMGTNNVARRANTKQFPLVKCINIGVVVASGTAMHCILNRKVLCEQKTTRLVTLHRQSPKNLMFDWNLLWYYLKPHIWYFFAAIAVSLFRQHFTI